MIRINNLKISVLIVFVIISITSCDRYVSYYDAITYKNITDLFAETKVLTNDCVNNLANGSAYLNQLSHLRLMSAQALEYEKRKAINENTVEQLKSINKSILRLYNRYGMNKFVNNKCTERSSSDAPDYESGCLRPAYCSSKMEVMTEKFNIALETEALKIQKNK